MMVINLGSINVDHVYQVPHFVEPGETLASTGYQQLLGGKGANQSIALAHALANSDETVQHLGLVNEAQCHIKQDLIREQVDCRYVKISEKPTGHAIIQVNESGENAIVLFAGANHDIQTDLVQQAIDEAPEGAWLLTQNETNAIGDAMRMAKEKGMKVAFNPAPMNDSVKQLPLNLVDLFIVNEVEAEDISGTRELAQIETFFKQHYPNAAVIITLGKAGAVMIKGGERIQVPAFEVEAVDTTAAGDTFIGYFLASYMKNNNAQKALTQACAASAIAVTRPGASPSIPKAEEVHAFLEKQGG
ncbi:ribokinase [Alteromonas sp. a30]|uniref:ribokinase n=1 Tax=Alteromonas sp. a30 TaxID=2730917 RepID=UPI0022825A1B|nr:ribokinase [Alteromonas sp. a30]MCY7296090.1 ribokinase [Alteromonas sp. a30]